MKKTLSILLALVMVFSLCGVSTFAAVNDAVIAISVEPSATTYAKGDTVTFNVYYETTNEIGEVGPGCFDFGFDSTVFETLVPMTTKVTTAEAGVSFTGTQYGFNGIVNDTYSSAKIGKALAQTEDTDKGWNTSIQITLCPILGKFVSCSTKTLVFSFQLKVKDDASATGCYTVGVTKTSVEDGTLLVAEEVGDLQYDDAAGFEFTTSKIFERKDATVALGAAAPTVTTTDPQVQWQNKEDGTMRMGFTGKIAGFTPVYSSGDELSNITACGVIYSTDSAATLEVGAANTNNVSCYTIYGAATGTDFTFRAIMNDVPYNGTGAMYFRAYIVYNGTTIYGAADSTTANDQYLEGVTAGLAAFGA